MGGDEIVSHISIFFYVLEWPKVSASTSVGVEIYSLHPIILVNFDGIIILRNL